MKLSASLCLLLVLPVANGSSQSSQIEDPGPFVVGTQAISIPDPNSSATIPGMLYYPALTAGAGAQPDTANGPYPLVGFGHGWLLGPEGYDGLSTHIASWGFFVVSVGTQTGFIANMRAEAQDEASLMDYMANQSSDATSTYFTMISDDDWSAVGHSMGGGGVFYLIGFEPRIRVLVSMEPYKGLHFGGTDASQPNIDSFTGDVMVIGGDADTQAPAASMGFLYYLDLDQSGRRIFWEVEGMGHDGPTDITPIDEPLSAPEQQRMHRLLVTGFLRAEIKSEENLYFQMIGEEGMQEPVFDLEAIALDPIHWSDVSVLNSNAISPGLAGTPGDLAVLAASLNTISLQTPYGLLGLDPSPGVFSVLFGAALDASGLVSQKTPLDASLSGTTIYTQALVLDGSPGILTRTEAVTAP